MSTYRVFLLSYKLGGNMQRIFTQNTQSPIDETKLSVARLAAEKFKNEKTKLLKADLILIIEQIIPVLGGEK